VIHVIGGGLAGSEAAWQAAERGERVTIHEMRPVRATAVHKTDQLAELVCSNSFRGDKLDNAVGLLKEEMRRLGSVVMRAADAARVPAGAALAVDREQFSRGVTNAVASHARITLVREEIRRPDFGHLEIKVTVDDPKAYTKPWTVTLKQRIVVDTELIDEICLENEKFVEFVDRIKR